MTRRRQVILAVVLWLVLAFVVWNVVFDLEVVLAGRRYSREADTLFRTTGTYLRIDDVMRPAVSHGARMASMIAAAIAVAGMLMIRYAATINITKVTKNTKDSS